jgi:hypothetical protein
MTLIFLSLRFIRQTISRTGILHRVSFDSASDVLVVSIATNLVAVCLSVFWKVLSPALASTVALVNSTRLLPGSHDEALNDILTDPSKFVPRTMLLSGSSHFPS